MIEVLYKNYDLKTFNSAEEIVNNLVDLLSVQLIDYSTEDLKGISQKFSLDLSSFTQNEDIEISSHFHETAEQLAFNFSIPYSSINSTLEEEQVFFIIKNEVFFSFVKTDIENTFQQVSKLGKEAIYEQIKSHIDIFLFLIGSISDYFADLTEFISKKIKQLSVNTLKVEHFSESDLDMITELNFSNILIKESLTEFQRILILLRKNKPIGEEINKPINNELMDLAVVTEHIQYNFERLDDLRENITSKIDLEQNKIFKTLTIITVCISAPTLVAALYGMNFSEMPQLKWEFGYPIAIVVLLTSFTLPLIIFKRKKWY